MPDDLGHLTPDEFRAARATSWSSGAPGTSSRSRTCPSGPPSSPGWVRDQLPGGGARRQAEPWADVLADLDRVVVPGGHPLAVAPLPRLLPRQLQPGGRCSASWPSAALGQQGMLWATSPATTELEQVTCATGSSTLLGLPDGVPPRRRHAAAA